MKNALLTILFAVFVVYVSGQSQRFVLFEEFTNASCGPCASQNPAFDALLSANTDKCTSIKYHTNWPGTDPMNAHNPSEVSTRVTYYGVTGVPHAVMDGTPVSGSSYLGAPANTTQAKIDNEYAIPSPFDLYINQSLSAGNDTIFVTMLGKATQDVSGTFVAHIAVIEKHIHFNSAPGTNGEKDFYNVMKKMLPSASGTTLSGNFSTGDYFIIEQAWKLANVYNNNELSVVGFIQNNQNKNVQQAANTSATPINGVYVNDVEMLEIGNVTPTYCTSSIAPTLTIRNNGSSPLTSVTIMYGVNSNTQSFTWTGNLNFLEKATIQLPEASYTLAHENELVLYAVNPNMVSDEYKKNDTIHYSFTDALQVGTVATVKIKTDNKPQETTWVITDPNGVIVGSGGPYANASTIYTENVNLDFGTCYQFTIYDAGGDGVCCGNGYGYYKLTSGSTTIESGTQFGSSESAQFYSQSGVGIPQTANVFKASIYPNPTTSLSTLTFSTDKPEKAGVTVFDMLGNRVLTIPAKQFDAGQHEISLDCAKLPSGLYNVRIFTGEKAINLKLTVNK
jgi:hypothetical protein